MKIRQRTPKPENKRDYTLIGAIIAATATVVAALIAIFPSILNKPPQPTSVVEMPTLFATITSALTNTVSGNVIPAITTAVDVLPTATILVPIATPQPSPTVGSVVFAHELPIYNAESSSVANCPADCSAFRLFDGSTSYGGSWGSAVGDGAGAWVRLFLPDTYTLTQINFFLDIPAINVLDQVKDFTLTFDDGSTYNGHLSFTGGWQSVDVPPVNVSTVQITIDDVYPSETYHNNQVEIKEIQLYGVDSQANNLSTPTASVTQLVKLDVFKAESSSVANCPADCSASRLFDGSTSYGGSWGSAVGDEIGAWVRLFIPEPHLIAQIKVFMVVPVKDVLDQLRDITLTFDNGSTYNARILFNDGWQIINFPPVTTTVVQITTNSVYPSQNYHNSQIEIREIELYGK